MCTGKELVKRIDECLEKRGMTRTQLCKELDISTGSIANWENRDNIPNANIALLMAVKLNTTVEYLLLGEGNNPYKSIIEEKDNEIKLLKDKIAKLYEETR